jgi:hypothetical protein
MKNVVFWCGYLGTHTITKQGQGAEHNSSTEKRKKANNKVQQVPSIYTA